VRARYGLAVLLGRTGEQRRIAALLECAREGTSATLVLVGEAGIGKTALLEYAAAQAADFQIARARGVESETELPFVGLLDLCRPFLGLLDRLEPQQAAVLRVTFGLRGEQEATGFAIGAATLSLLAAAAEDEPLLLLVDDAHWLDRGSADALAFAVRRLRADAVAALIATRPAEGRPYSRRDLPDLELAGLDEAAATQLLAREGATLDSASTRAILDLAAGNPLALLELPSEARALIGGAEPVRLGTRLERAFAGRVDALPEATRHAVLLAAVSDIAELHVLRAALEQLGLSLAELEPAESARLVSLGGGVLQFRHPLVRSAIYHAADPVERRRAHAAMASVLGQDERAAWHLAAAALGPDEVAAEALERAAKTARRRSGFTAAAAAFERAARLSEERSRRARRLTAGADAAWLGGGTSHALALLEEAIVDTHAAPARGALLHTRGTIEHFVGDATRAHRTLEEAAELLAVEDPRQACLSLTEAVGSALFVGEVERAVSLGQRALAIADAERLDQRLFASVPRGASLLLAGRPEEGLPFLMRAVDAIRGDVLEDDPRNLTWAALAGWWVGDGELMVRKATGAVEWAREHAAPALLPWAGMLLGLGLIMTGRWREARAALVEGVEAGRLTSQEGHLAMVLSALAWLDAAQGRADDCRSEVEEGIAIAERLGLVWFRNWLLHALVMLELGLGVDEDSPGVKRLRDSLAERGLRDPPTPPLSSWPNLIEALLRLDDVAGAEELFTPYAAEAERLGEPLPLALAERCRALRGGVNSFEDHCERAVALHAFAPNEFEAARTLLVYGERLRRSGRRIDAREQLRAALAVFERLEAEPWAERTRAELRATGERLRKRDPASRDELTSQEVQIALVVAGGKTNREAGAQLFLSPKTVEWHLGNIFHKLGVRSRAELARALREDTPDVSARSTRLPARRP
jgi:DNA-binding CsgD family transcriptional regulator